MLFAVWLLCMGLFCAKQLNGMSFAEFFRINAEVNEYIEEIGRKDLSAAYEDILTIYSRRHYDKALEIVCGKLEHLAGYNLYVRNIISNADQMSRRSLFASGGYPLKNIIKTGRDYGKLISIEPVLDNDRGIEAFLVYQELYFFIGAAAVIIVGLFISFHTPMSRNITYCCYRGRGILGIRTMAGLLFMETMTAAVLYLSVYLESCIMYGFADLSAPIQTLSIYADYTVILSRGVYLLINYLQMCLTIYSLSLIMWVFLICCNVNSIGVIGLCVFAGAEALLYLNIEPNSKWELLRNVNIIKILYTPGIAMKYRNINVFGIPVRLSVILYGCLAFISIVFLTVSFMLEHWRSPVEELPSGERGRLMTALHRGWSRQGIFVKELYKLMVSRKALVILLFFFVTAVYFINDSEFHFGSTQIKTDALYKEIGYSGIEGLRSKYNELKEELYRIEEDMSTADQRLADGEINESEYMTIYMRYSGRQPQKDLCEKLYEKLAGLENISAEYGIAPVVMPENGYEQAVGAGSLKREIIVGLLFYSAVWIIVVDYFAYERKIKAKSFFYVLKKGGTELYRKKLTVSLLGTALLFILIYGYDCIKVLQWYELPFSEAQAVNISFMGDSGYLGSMGSWLFLCLLVRILLAVTAAVSAAAVTVGIGTKAQAGVIPMAGLTVAVVYYTYNNRAALLAALGGLLICIFCAVIAGGILWNRSNA